MPFLSSPCKKLPKHTLTFPDHLTNSEGDVNMELFALCVRISQLCRLFAVDTWNRRLLEAFTLQPWVHHCFHCNPTVSTVAHFLFLKHSKPVVAGVEMEYIVFLQDMFCSFTKCMN